MKDDVKIVQEVVLDYIQNRWNGWQEQDVDKILKADYGILAGLEKLEEITGFEWDVDIRTGEFYSYWYSTL